MVQFTAAPVPESLGAPFLQTLDVLFMLLVVEKHASAMTFEAVIKGWLASTPVSSTATAWPVPVAPFAYAPPFGVVIPIIGTEWKRLTRYGRSAFKRITSESPARFSSSDGVTLITNRELIVPRFKALSKP